MAFPARLLPTHFVGGSSSTDLKTARERGLHGIFAKLRERFSGLCRSWEIMQKERAAMEELAKEAKFNSKGKPGNFSLKWQENLGAPP